MDSEFSECGAPTASVVHEKPASVRVAPAARHATLPSHDPDRMGEVLADLEPRLFATALRFTRDRDAARDVVQNAFEKVLRHSETFQGRARISTWVHRIVINEALMWLRSRRRRREEQPGAGPTRPILAIDDSPTAAEALESHEQLQRLRSCLRQLPDEERDVMRWCALSGQSYAEYGARRGVHPAAVKSRAFRARRRLARMLVD